MVHAIYSRISDMQLVRKFLPALLKEYHFWNSGIHKVTIQDAQSFNHSLNRYCAMWNKPRPESSTIIEDTKTMYQSNYKNAFQLKHCWRILRNEAKWLILRENLKASTRQPTTQFCYTFTSSINLDEDNDKMNTGETLERPIGKKAKKKKLKKRKNCDDVVSILSSQLDEIKEKKEENA